VINNTHLSDVDVNGNSRAMTSMPKMSDAKGGMEQILAMSEAETQNLYKSYQYGTSTQRQVLLIVAANNVLFINVCMNVVN